jgi:hypothetical protein
MNKLPVMLRSAVKAGWYEGGVFFAIAGKDYLSVPYQYFTPSDTLVLQMS